MTMPVELSVDQHVALVTLNRPEKLNSIDPTMRAQLAAVWRRLDEDEDIRVAVITGSGDRAFCAGSDLAATTAAAPFAAEFFGRRSNGHLLYGVPADIPLIAAVNGLAVGGGFEIALACDIRLAVDTAEFGLTEVRVGSMPGAGGTQRLLRAVGESLGMQMLLTGDRINAQRALQAGLVSEVLPPADLLDRALAVAARIAANAPLSVRAVKQVVRLGRDAPLTVGLDLERLAFGAIRGTEDRREGRQAFVEKRPAEFRGR
jgi:E-phenylitaconyl-CoA hydratase